MKSYNNIIMMVMLLGLVALATAISYPKEVVTLTKDNMIEELTKKEFALVEFYAPWCGHCKSLAPEYSAAAKEGVKNVVFAAIDCTAETSGKICDEHGIQGFPTIQLWKNGKYYKEFEGDRTAKAIVSYLNKKTQPPVSVVEEKVVEAAVAAGVAAGKVIVVGRKMNKDSIKDFSKVADIFDFVFFAVEGEGEPEFTLYAKHLKNEQKSVYAEADYKTVQDWINAKAYPLVGSIDQNSFVRYDQSGLPLLFLFTKISEKDANIPLVEAAAEKFQGKINVGYIDGVQWKEQLSIMGFSESIELPQVAILNIGKQLSYPLVTEKVTTEAVNEFVEKFVAGKAEPFLRSEEVPAKPVDEHNVFKAVGKNFEESVIKANKDVLVMFYAPWCGHCKTLKPVWNKVATHIKSVEDVVIAKMDSTQNDVASVAIDGFPTLFLFKKDGSKVAFDGARSGKSILEFLAKNVDSAEAIKALGAVAEDDVVTPEESAEEDEEDDDDLDWADEVDGEDKHADL